MVLSKQESPSTKNRDILDKLEEHAESGLFLAESKFVLTDNNFKPFTFDDSPHFNTEASQIPNLTLSSHRGFSSAFIKAYVALFLEKQPLQTLANLEKTAMEAIFSSFAKDAEEFSAYFIEYMHRPENHAQLQRLFNTVELVYFYHLAFTNHLVTNIKDENRTIETVHKQAEVILNFSIGALPISFDFLPLTSAFQQCFEVVLEAKQQEEASANPITISTLYEPARKIPARISTLILWFLENFEVFLRSNYQSPWFDPLASRGNQEDLFSYYNALCKDLNKFMLCFEGLSEKDYQPFLGPHHNHLSSVPRAVFDLQKIYKIIENCMRKHLSLDSVSDLEFSLSYVYNLCSMKETLKEVLAEIKSEYNFNNDSRFLQLFSIAVIMLYKDESTSKKLPRTMNFTDFCKSLTQRLFLCLQADPQVRNVFFSFAPLSLKAQHQESDIQKLKSFLQEQNANHPLSNSVSAPSSLAFFSDGGTSTDPARTLTDTREYPSLRRDI